MENCFYCEQCGGELEILPGGIGRCIYNPRHIQKIPRENEGKYQRAQVLRRDNKDFDGAMRIYEQILLDDPEESAAHWELVLCIYGIEYVRDYNGNYLPTCHRIIEQSILDNGDYQKALFYAKTEEEKQKYQTQAELIERYQKRIKQIAASEEPYDVFISYKERDSHGSTTPDCELADKIYNYLTKELKLRTFFSQVSLKGKTGEYEPYIYAALQSSKVMVVVSSRREYLESPWVKNEWSRFLRMIPDAEKKGKRKAVTVALAGNMAPEMLPSELSGYQATSLEGLGVLERFCHNIDHYIGEEKTTEKSTSVDLETLAGMMAQDEVQNYIEMADNFRMAHKYGEASNYYNKALERDAKNGHAYWGKFLSSLQVADGSTQIQYTMANLENQEEYKVAVQNSDPETNEKYRKILQQACSEFEKKDTQERYNKAYADINTYYWDGTTELKDGISEKSVHAMENCWAKNREKNKVFEELRKAKSRIGFIVSAYLLMILALPALYPIYNGTAWEEKMELGIFGGLAILTFVLIFIDRAKDDEYILGILYGVVGAASLLGAIIVPISVFITTDIWGRNVWLISVFAEILCIAFIVLKIRRWMRAKKSFTAAGEESEKACAFLRECLQEDVDVLNHLFAEEEPYGSETVLKDKLNLDMYKER